MNKGARKTHRGACGNERGMTVVVAILIVVVIVIVGFSTLMMVSTDLQIAGNYGSTQKALFSAEAGVNEALSRLRADSANPITDAHPSSATWSVYIGTDVKAQGKGYDTTNAMHVLVSSLQSALDYTVRIRHQTDGAGNLLYWGDADGDGDYERNTTTGSNIYLISSYGASSGSNRTIEVEAARKPPLPVPAALSVNAATSIQGSSTNVIGNDACGSADKPGIVTGQAISTVTTNGNPTIAGTTPIVHTSTPLNVQALIDTYKTSANFTYHVESATQTNTTTPGPGDGWGTPVLGESDTDPSTCGVMNIVYYNTKTSAGVPTDISLTGGATGCGLLLIEGDAFLHGGFSWNGAVLVSGSVTFTGGGTKNVTGAMISGGSTDADVVGGNANIIYCSTAILALTANQPLDVLSWKDVR